ncbi:hypothetical protein SNE40_008488 [Patella caerulea]|uniref:G-protein coupled receptors family 1 profile domain-containing protein n=1 Tax=Patella caerulea TaxID=87958 RepID=A0AAN8JYY3_PATCE
MASFNFSVTSPLFDTSTEEWNSTNSATLCPEETTRPTDQQGSAPYQGFVTPEAYLSFIEKSGYFIYPLTFLAFLFCGFGVIVYSTKQMRSPTSIYLLAVNLTELANVVINMATETTGFIYGDRASDSLIYIVIFYYFNAYLGTSVRRTTFWLSSLLSAERCIAVCYPLKSKCFKLVRYPVVTAISVTISSVLFHVFVALKLFLYQYQSKDSNATLWKLLPTESFVTDRAPYDAMSIASKVLFVVLPLLGCLIFNFITVVALRIHTKTRASMTGSVGIKSNNNDSKTTITVLASTFVLVIMALPSNITSFIGNVDADLQAKELYSFLVFRRIGRLCELISNCVGFICYMTLSARFRKTFIGIFCPCRSKKSSINESSCQSSASRETGLSTISEEG